MLNLGNLITASLLSMGVANVTPIYDKQPNNNLTEKAEENTSNIVQDYTIDLTKTYINDLETNNQIINGINTDAYDKGTLKDVKYNINGTNNYLNIVGNEYRTIAYKKSTDANNPELADIYMYKNVEDYGVNFQPYINYTRVVTLLKFNSYNFNKDVNAHITINFDVEDFYPTYTDEIIIDYVAMGRNVYTTTKSNWDSLIGRQTTTNQCKTIIDEIKNVNNGFYYSETSEIFEIDAYNYTDEFDLEIVQGGATYIAIEYTPLVKAHFYDHYANDTYDYTYSNVMSTQSMFQINTYTISGTNIIVQGGYEVIDLPGLMWQILTMPFAFVSQAFNLTLFPGTPYQLNIANLFLSIIAILTFVWLISFFLKR